MSKISHSSKTKMSQKNDADISKDKDTLDKDTFSKKISQVKTKQIESSPNSGTDYQIYEPPGINAGAQTRFGFSYNPNSFTVTLPSTENNLKEDIGAEVIISAGNRSVNAIVIGFSDDGRMYGTPAVLDALRLESQGEVVGVDFTGNRQSLPKDREERSRFDLGSLYNTQTAQQANRAASQPAPSQPAPVAAPQRSSPVVAPANNAPANVQEAANLAFAVQEAFEIHGGDQVTGIETYPYGLAMENYRKRARDRMSQYGENKIKASEIVAKEVLGEKANEILAWANSNSVQLNSYQLAGLASLTYNAGGLENYPSITNALKAGNYPAAADAFGLVVNSGGQYYYGLARRRSWEAYLFMGNALNQNDINLIQNNVEAMGPGFYRFDREKPNRTSATPLDRLQAWWSHLTGGSRVS
jgi:GH24 family phage-related lysozyme (muramidase)